MANTKKSKKNQSGVSTRDHIVAVARPLFALHGYENTPTERILEESGVSRGALYHHFENKEALFAAVLEAVEEELVAAAIQVSASATDPSEGLRRAFDSFLEKACEPEVRQIVLVDAHSVVGWQKWREIEERYGLGLLKQGLTIMVSTGRIDEEMVDVYAHVLLASLVEIAFLVSQSPEPAAEAEKGNRVMARLLDRLLSD